VWYVQGEVKFPHHSTPDFSALNSNTGATGYTTDPYAIALTQTNSYLYPDMEYLFNDHLGSTRMIYKLNYNCAGVFQNTTIQYMADYYSFGKIVREYINPGTTAEKYQYSGKERDTESGYDYFNARNYHSEVGRFLSVDPLAGKYPGWSSYNYTMNNPMNMVDPDGMQADDVILRGKDEEFNWTPGSEYLGSDKFIQSAVQALSVLTTNSNIANFSFKGAPGTGIHFEGNAILDYVQGGAKEAKDVFIENAENNPENPGSNQHIEGVVYWDHSSGITEEGFNGEKGGGSFPPMGTLLHEMGHAALFNEFGGRDWMARQNKFLNEEQMIIDHLEKPAMQSLGFGFRSGHNTSNNRSEMIQSVKSQITHRMPVKGSYYMPSPNPTKLK